MCADAGWTLYIVYSLVSISWLALVELLDCRYYTLLALHAPPKDRVM